MELYLAADEVVVDTSKFCLYSSRPERHRFTATITGWDNVGLDDYFPISEELAELLSRPALGRLIEWKDEPLLVSITVTKG